MHAFIWSSSIHPFSSTVGEHRCRERFKNLSCKKKTYIYVSSSMILFCAYETDLWPWFIYLFIYMCILYMLLQCWWILARSKMDQTKKSLVSTGMMHITSHMAPLMCSCVFCNRTICLVFRTDKHNWRGKRAPQTLSVGGWRCTF